MVLCFPFLKSSRCEDNISKMLILFVVKQLRSFETNPIFIYIFAEPKTDRPIGDFEIFFTSVFMSICTSICTYVRPYVHMFIRTYVHTYIRTYFCMSIRPYVSTLISLFYTANIRRSPKIFF